MEIENNRVASLVTPSSGQSGSVEQQDGKDKSSADSATTSGSDKVSLTGNASRLQELERELQSRPVVDGQRVDAVRTAIENGTFEVNPERIAEKMMSLEQALTDTR